MALGADIEREVAILEAARDIVPREVEKMYPNEALQAIGRGTCVYTTRVTIDVLRHFGIRSKPTPCAVGVFNEAMVNRVRAEGRFPKDMAEAKVWAKEDGSWGVAIGRTGDSSPNRLDAHLVVVTHRGEGAEGVMLDLSLPQNSRPMRKMMLEPIIATLPEGFYEDDKPLVCEAGNGSMVRYQFAPEMRGRWTDGADWHDQARRHTTVQEAIRRIEQRLSD